MSFAHTFHCARCNEDIEIETTCGPECKASRFEHMHTLYDYATSIGCEVSVVVNNSVRTIRGAPRVHYIHTTFVCAACARQPVWN